MAITYPLALPTTTGVKSITFRAINAVAVSRSPFTYKEQVVSHAGKRWEADIALPAMKEETAEIWLSFLLSLKGQRGTFLLGDPIASIPRGTARNASSPVVDGSTANTLDISCSSLSQTGYLKAGDYIQLGTGSASRLYKVLQDVNTDAAGNATLDLWPDIIAAPSIGAAINFESTQGVFRLTSNSSEWSVNELSIYGIAFGAVQAIA